MVMGLVIYAKTVDLTIATIKDVFVKTDLLETDFEKQILTAKIVNYSISEDKTNYSLNFSLPSLVKNEDKTFTVQETTMGINVNLSEIYNGCRNSGQTKIQCVAYIKELVVNEVKSVKQRAVEEATRLKNEVEKIDYLDEITAEDFATIDINPIK